MIQDFKRILVFADRNTPSSAVLDRGAMLAGLNGGVLTVMDVVESSARKLPLLGDALSAAQVQAYLVENRTRELEELAAPVRAFGVDVRVRVATGTAFLEIIRDVLANDQQLAVVAAEGRGRISEMLFGTTTMHLIRKCPCPVWVLKRHEQTRFARIMAAVDPDTDGESANTLNDRIMSLAAALTDLEHGTLHVVHAWKLFGEHALTGLRTSISQEQIKQLLRDTKQEHRQAVEQLVRRHKAENRPQAVHVLKGDPGIVIPEVATAKKIDLIVMGSLCQSGIAGLMMGDTAETVLRAVHCSVLTLKPEGFVTPVRMENP
jgi:universal stress protein E